VILDHVTLWQIESALASKDEQLKQIEQKKEADIEAAHTVSLPLIDFSAHLSNCFGVLIFPTSQILQNSTDNAEIARSFVTLLR
jgi:hypothetical protein